MLAILQVNVAIEAGYRCRLGRSNHQARLILICMTVRHLHVRIADVQTYNEVTGGFVFTGHVAP
ncbi:hypothetical protein D3C84_1124410 [compost metagenome]